ncbi:MAG: DNA polymerase III subunit gamma/tau, partial [Oscillospiraceae bacterium]|nr:DNA polymerase III subunit gamma/tau [Oscillospiraceae bacterium]
MYQALYRKWRPQTFDEVVGQDHITETLKNQVKSGHLSHAYIFIGTRGTGKTTCARILAKAVNCEHPVNGNPCGVCPACRGIADGSVMDVVELDAASNNGVDNVRALREEAVFSPAAVKKRVYIIDEVHMLSTSAFNALLKILEEPPEHLMFILATTELQKVPATILSRCQRHSFRRIDAQKIAAYLERIAQSEHFELSHDAAELIARLAEGGVRDALSLLDQCSAYDKIDVEAVYTAMGLAGNRRISGMLDRIIRHDAPGAITDFNSLWMDGKDPATFLKELSSLMRDVLIEHVSPKNAMALVTGGYDAATLSNFAGRMTKEELICAMETVQRYSAQMREVKNPKTVVELCLISLCDNTLGESIAELRARVSRLEANVGRAPQPAPEYRPAPQSDTPAPAYEPAPAPQDYERPPLPDIEPDYERPPLPDIEPEYVPIPEPIDEPPARPAPVRAETAERAAAPSYTAAPEYSAAPTQNDAEFWRAVCDKASPKLAPDLRVTISSEDK